MDESERRMTFAEHLNELRSRLIKSLLAVAGALAVCLWQMDAIKAFVIDGPHLRATEMLQKEYPGVTFELIAGTYQAPFIAYFKLCILVSLFLASPFLGYQMWRFIGAGLYKHERRYVAIFSPVSLGLFMGGCVFGFWVMVPYALWFLADIADPARVKPLFTVSEYLGLVTMFTLALGAVFQLPLLMMFFARVGLATPKAYLKHWRGAIVGIFIAAAVFTPPDPLSMFLMAGPMLVLYFAGVALSAWVQPKT